MRPHALIAVLFLSACASAPTGVGLAWMRGRWCGPHENGTFCETWRSVDGSLAGAGAHTRDGRELFRESLRIERRDGEVVYLASPHGGAVTPFRLTRSSDREAVFENPAHDFPQRITYRLVAPDRLVAVVDGGGRSETFTLTREGELK